MIKYHNNLIQGSEEWKAARCGLLTASEMKHIITAKNMQYASNDKAKSHMYEILAQRITGYVEPHYISDDMMRGKDDEIDAKIAYEEAYEKVSDVGFITNDCFGFTLGYSPDGLVGNDGVIEVKSRRQKFQFETILEEKVPDEYMIQIQTGLLISERKWCDFISYCGGVHMLTIRIINDVDMQAKIIATARAFHEKIELLLQSYNEKIMRKDIRLFPTVRRIEEEITL